METMSKMLVLKNISKLKSLDLPILLGHSRKRFLGDIAGIPLEADRDLATAIVTALCGSKDISIVRTHDVVSTRQALLISQAMQAVD